MEMFPSIPSKAQKQIRVDLGILAVVFVKELVLRLQGDIYA
jgi:hypothetical protein